MRRIMTAALMGVLLWAPQARAEAVTVKALRALVMARDTGAVEQALKAHQAAFLTGEVSAWDARTPFAVFETTHPDVIAFTADWLAAAPKSGYAQVLYKMGWLVRGDKSGRETYPRAVNEHYAMHGAALELALAAYESDPDLLAASDTVIRLGNTGGDKDRVADVVLKVMANRPNYFTIRQSFDLTHPG